ncbi:MAG: CotH kinase family protein [Muribaculaceae bacterium]|nr:CotH kinase family protein [Muribaculaceae bacterium]
MKNRRRHRPVRLLTLALAAITCALAASAQFTVGGVTPVYDSRSNTFLCAIDTARLRNLPATLEIVNSGSDYRVVKIEGVSGTIGASATVTVPDIQYGKTMQLTLQNGISQRTSSLAFTFLPILELTGDFGYEYAEGDVTLTEPGGANSGAMHAKLKWRGASTNTEGKQKRNYHIKFLNEKGKKQDRTFFGLREDNNWLLDACQVDLTRVRNRASTDLWLDFATKPYYYDKEPKALTGVRGRFVEVFLNGEYRGIYCMTEQIDRKQMKLKKYDEDAAAFHGMLWKAKTYTVCVDMWEDKPYNNSQEMWEGYEVKYPDFDDVNPTDYSVLHDAVSFVAKSSQEQFYKGYRDVFDIPVLVDYYLFLDVLGAIDNKFANVYWACYDQASERKITPAVWDLDVTMGIGWAGYMIDPTLDIYAESEGYPSLLWHLNDCTQGEFREMQKKRYTELRQTVFTEKNLARYYTGYTHDLTRCGAAKRDSLRWSGGSDLEGARINVWYDDENLAGWLKTRLGTLDSRYGYGQGIEDNDIAAPEEALRVIVNAGIIRVVDDAIGSDGVINVYDTQGRALYSGRERTITIQHKGVLIVKSGSKVAKVLN